MLRFSKGPLGRGAALLCPFLSIPGVLPWGQEQLAEKPAVSATVFSPVPLFSQGLQHVRTRGLGELRPPAQAAYGSGACFTVREGPNGSLLRPVGAVPIPAACSDGGPGKSWPTQQRHSALLSSPAPASSLLTLPAPKSSPCHQLASWRNGSASDSRSEGCVFKSHRGQAGEC